MARVYAHNHGARAIRTCLEATPGHGGNTGGFVQTRLAEGLRFMLVVVDSDKSSPQAALGTTASQVRRVFDSSSNNISKLIILKAHELENLLPDSFYLLPLQEHQSHLSSLGFLNHLHRTSCVLARLYIDIKGGTTLEDMLSLQSRAQDHNSVWGPVLEALRQNRIPSPHNVQQCLVVGVCSRANLCECILASPNGSELLVLGETYLKRNAAEAWNSMPLYLRDVFEEIAKTAFDWGFASSPQAT